ncbi:MAG: peptidase S41 [Sphingomonas sp.]|uniref:S41 family peptidase n=1 Tax=Sphingomonas sp. TaxID=28214 RepID=UPI0017B72081|nr:S41 family peptidase [Sphingomonas sp.]MBA3666728.1 peptidase S41 [Sphingomonas sp.]
MRATRFTTLTSIVALLAACGGGGSDSGGSAPPVAVAPTPTQTTAGCSLRERQDWAAGQLREWYLFPELLPAALDPGAYTTVGAYIDALTATARAQSKDRFFTYLTSIAAENAFYESGSTAGFGIRLSYDAGAGRLFVTEAFEGAPALAAGIDRGTEIIAIGTSVASLRTVASIFASEGAAGVNAALGSSEAGVTRVLRVSSGGVERDVTVTKATYEISPVSARYGAKVIDDNGRKVGYLNLRTFISTADPQLRMAFDTFRLQGINQVIVDFRYNGGGLVAIADLMGNLMGAGRINNVFSYTSFRPEKASNNSTTLFTPLSQSIAPVKIAFIGTGGTASASELVINSFTPYLHANSALIGSNTYGKPVGQIALDRSQCDDRLRVVAFKTENANRQGDYYNGLATKVEASCQAADDIMRPLGDPSEGSVKGALDFLAGRTCTPISVGGTQTSQSLRGREILQSSQPDTAEREVPGLH